MQPDLPEVDLPKTLAALQSRGLAVRRAYTRDPEFTEHGRAPRHCFLEWSRDPNRLELELARHLTGGAVRIADESY